MDWLTFGASVGSSTVVGSLVTVFGGGWIKTNQAREERYTKRVDAARLALTRLRTAYQTADTPEPSDDFVAAEADFDTAIGGCDSNLVLQAGRSYRDTGRLFSSSDPDTSKQAEEAAYDAVLEALNTITRKYLPR